MAKDSTFPCGPQGCAAGGAQAAERQAAGAGKTAKKGRLSCSERVPFFSKTVPFLAALQRKEKAAKRIQRNWRRRVWKVRWRSFITEKKAATLLQSRVRGMLGRKALGRLMLEMVPITAFQCRSLPFLVLTLPLPCVCTACPCVFTACPCLPRWRTWPSWLCRQPSAGTSATLPFLDLPLPFHCPSLTSQCRFTAFPRPSTAFSPPSGAAKCSSASGRSPRRS